MSNELKQASIQEKCVATYTKNMEYFKEHFPDLEKKLTTFNHAIEFDMYEPNWELEYKDNKYFDLHNIKDKYFYYNINTLEDAKKVTDNVKTDDSNSFSLIKGVLLRKDAKPTEKFMDDPISHLYPMYKYMFKHNTQLNDYKKIEKFMFIGTGIGLHIPMICEKIKAKTYLIVEPNLEIFRLSLFTADYTNLLKDPEDLFFSVAEKPDEFYKTFKKFYAKFNFLNYRLKFNCVSENYHNYFDFIASFINDMDPTRFPFSIMLTSLQRIFDYKNEDYKFLEYNEKILNKHPVCIVAPGPSLEKNIKWLEKNQDRFIIVALGAALKKLDKHNIIPNIITSVDPHKIVENQLDVNEKTYKNSILLCSTNIHPEVVEKFDKENVFMYPVLYNFGFNNSYPLGGATVGEVTYALTLILGAKELYLLGTDVALDPETGASHTKEHIHYKTRDKLQKTDIKEFTNIKSDDLVEVKGNFIDTVFTTRLFQQVINQYNSYTKQLKKDQKIYNLSNGAYLNDTEPLKIEDLLTDKMVHFDKEALQEELLEEFNNNKNNWFTENELKILKKDLSYMEKGLKNIKKYKKLKFKNYDEFQYQKLGLIIEQKELLDKKLIFNSLPSILSSYYAMTETFIYNFFESQSILKSDKKVVNAINRYWTEIYENIFLSVIKMHKKTLNKKKEA